MNILDSKLQFIRSLEICCRQHIVIWHIAGDFVDEMLGQCHNTNPTCLDVYLYSNETSCEHVINQQFK